MYRGNQSDDAAIEICLAEVVISIGAANLSSVRGIFTDKVRQAVLPIGNVAVINRRLPSVRAVGNKSLNHTRIRLIDRKSTRLNSSHRTISYAVFCLKKKK